LTERDEILVDSREGYAQETKCLSQRAFTAKAPRTEHGVEFVHTTRVRIDRTYRPQ
jgi:hypothetical protein